MTPADITNKLWNDCNVPRDDATTAPTAATARPPGPRRTQTAAGAPTTTTSWSPATTPASTSSGSGTSRCPTPTTSPPPEVIAQEIVTDLEAALEQFREIALDLGAGMAEEEAG
jgi:hypothetical protein